MCQISAKNSVALTPKLLQMFSQDVYTNEMLPCPTSLDTDVLSQVAPRAEDVDNQLRQERVNVMRAGFL
jgi:hypothetical protein